MITLSLKEWVIVHINYRGIFNAPVSLSELQQWMNLKDVELIQAALSELIAEDLIETDGDLNYCIKGKSAIFIHREGKRRLSRRALKNHTKIIRYISWMPFIQFIGISGSVAAENPTVSREGIHKDSFDLDIFIITSGNALWLVLFFERVITNIFTFLLGSRYKLCFNYAMDSTFLEVHNQSIYTATELSNLKPLYDCGDAYQHLIAANKWVEKYYPALKEHSNRGFDSTAKNNQRVTAAIAYPFNFLAYVLFQFSRVVKNLSLKPLLEIRKDFDPVGGRSLTRVCNEHGGYEYPILTQFDKSLRSNFRNYYRADIVNYMFPLTIQKHFMNFDLKDEHQHGFEKYIVSR